MRVRSLWRSDFATAHDGIEYFAIPVPRIWSVANRIRALYNPWHQELQMYSVFFVVWQSDGEFS
jgi:hypothetical protein